MIDPFSRPKSLQMSYQPTYTFVASGILSLNVLGCACVSHSVTMLWLPSEEVSARALQTSSPAPCVCTCVSPFRYQVKSFSELCRWIFPKLLRRLLKEFMDITNATRMRKDRNKIGPSGMSRNEAYSAPESWGGQNYLIPVDINVIHELKRLLAGRTSSRSFLKSLSNGPRSHSKHWVSRN